MPAFPPHATVMSALRQAEEAQENRRPCTLRFEDGLEVAAAEGVVRYQPSLRADGGGMVDVKQCTFRVLKSLLSAVPVTGTVVRVLPRDESLRLMLVQGGASESDPCWVLKCEEVEPA